MNPPILFEGTIRMFSDDRAMYTFRSFIDNKYGEVYLYPQNKRAELVKLEMELMAMSVIDREVYSAFGNKMRIWTEADGTIEVPIELINLFIGEYSRDIEVVSLENGESNYHLIKSAYYSSMGWETEVHDKSE